MFTDLTPEALDKKRELREVLAALREANIRHRWATPLKVQVLHKGKSYFMKNEADGHEILHLLGIPTPMTTERANAKRKLDMQARSPDMPSKHQRNFDHLLPVSGR